MTNLPSVEFYGGGPSIETSDKLGKWFTKEYMVNMKDVLSRFQHDGFVQNRGYDTQCWPCDDGYAMLKFVKWGELEKARSVADFYAGLLYRVNPPCWVRGYWYPGHAPFLYEAGDTTKNFGHERVLLGMYQLWRHLSGETPEGRFMAGIPVNPETGSGIVKGVALVSEQTAWLRKNWNVVQTAADWLVKQSREGLDGLAFVISESAEQFFGAYSIYNNTDYILALRAASEMAHAMGMETKRRLYLSTAGRIEQGVLKHLVGTKKTKTPEGCWLHGLTRTGREVLVNSRWKAHGEVFGFKMDPSTLGHPHRLGAVNNWMRAGYYDTSVIPERWLKICRNTWRYVKEYQDEYVRKRWGKDYSGMVTTYGTLGGGWAWCSQGVITQSSLLLDEMEDAGLRLNIFARFSRHAEPNQWLCPENQIKPVFLKWQDRKAAKPGNTIGCCEMLDVGDIMIGLDDRGAESEGAIKLLPRLPNGWTGIKAAGQKVVTPSGLGTVSYTYLIDTEKKKITLRIETDRDLSIVIRMGPLPLGLSRGDILINKDKGKRVDFNLIKSGDSNWVWLEKQQLSKEKKGEYILTWH